MHDNCDRDPFLYLGTARAATDLAGLAAPPTTRSAVQGATAGALLRFRERTIQPHRVERYSSAVNVRWRNSAAISSSVHGSVDHTASCWDKCSMDDQTTFPSRPAADFWDGSCNDRESMVQGSDAADRRLPLAQCTRPAP